MIKHILKFQVLFLLFPLILTAQSERKPNIIIILADDLGWGDVGFNGGDIRTPNLDRLAATGLVLDRFYTTPICSPTRAGLLTGRYPNRFGLRQTVIPPWSSFGVDTAETFLPEFLGLAGYKHRAMIGKWHLGHARRMYLPLQRGFTHFYGHYNGAIDYFSHEREGELDWHRGESPAYEEGYATDLLSAEAVRCIREYAREEAPFFLYLAYNAPHSPLQAKEEDLREYGYDPDKPVFGKQGEEAQRGRGNTRRQTYAAMVSNMDKGIGQLLATLEELDIDENTLVLFFSDNGAAPGEGGSSGPLKGHKFQEWEGGVRSPAVIRWPAAIQGGARLGQVSGYVDVLPTLLDLAGLQGRVSRPLDGKSILGVLTGREASFDRDFYLGYGSLISGKWKLVEATRGNPRMEHEEDALYDIFADPYEERNLAGQHPEEYQRLKRLVAGYEAIRPGKEVPPYGEGRKGFKAPPEWKVVN